MLPNWKHSVFYDHECGSKIGKVAAAVAVYVRFALGERHQDVPLKTVGKMFAIGQRSVWKVITGKLYDSEGRRVESIFQQTQKAYVDDPINWDKEMENASNISQEEVIYEFDHQDSENADLPMLGAQTKVRDLKPVKAILERTPNFPRSSEGLEPPRLRVVFKRNQPFENQVITHVVTREAREEMYRQVGIKMSRQRVWQKQWSSLQKPCCQ